MDTEKLRESKDKVRDDIGPEDFGVPAEFAAAAVGYANWRIAAQPPKAADMRCEMCGFVGQEDPVIGCPRCKWDEMQPVELTATPTAAADREDAARYRKLKPMLLSADFEPEDYVGLTLALPKSSRVSPPSSRRSRACISLRREVRCE